MRQALSTQSHTGNQTSLYPLSFGRRSSRCNLRDHCLNLRLASCHCVHMHVTVVCSASDTRHHCMLCVGHAFGIIIIMCSASDTHSASSSMWLRHQVSPITSYDASRAKRRFSPSSRSCVFSSSPRMFHSTEIPEQCIAGSPAMFHSTSSF